MTSEERAYLRESFAMALGLWVLFEFMGGQLR